MCSAVYDLSVQSVRLTVLLRSRGLGSQSKRSVRSASVPSEAAVPTSVIDAGAVLTIDTGSAEPLALVKNSVFTDLTVKNATK